MILTKLHDDIGNDGLNCLAFNLCNITDDKCSNILLSRIISVWTGHTFVINLVACIVSIALKKHLELDCQCMNCFNDVNPRSHFTKGWWAHLIHIFLKYIFQTIKRHLNMGVCLKNNVINMFDCTAIYKLLLSISFRWVPCDLKNKNKYIWSRWVVDIFIWNIDGWPSQKQC